MPFILNRIIIVLVVLSLFSCKKKLNEKNVNQKSKLTSSKSALEIKKQDDFEVITYSYLYKEKVGEGEFIEKQDLEVQWIDSLNLKFKITMVNSMCEMKDEAEALLIEKNTFKVKNHSVLKQLKFNANKNEIKLICDYGELRDECDPMEMVIMKRKTIVSTTTNKGSLVKEDLVLEKEEAIKYETIYAIKKMKFSTDCSSDDYVFFLVGGQFKTKNIFLNTRLKKINESEFYIYFSPPLLNPLPSGLKDVASFSLSKPIGKVIHDKEAEIQFEWYGFYNRKTKEREFKKNPFTNKIENDFIVLKWCDIGNVNDF